MQIFQLATAKRISPAITNQHSAIGVQVTSVVILSDPAPSLAKKR
jgi:hypothetical protein